MELGELINGFDGDAVNLVRDILKDPDIRKKLEKLKKHHVNSYKHCIRVGFYCVEIGKMNNFDKDQLRILATAGILHDYGKLFISSEILKKNGTLTEDEFQKIKEHPRRTYIALSEPKFQACREIAVAHHEYQDNPYPRSRQDRRKVSRQTERRKTESFSEECSQMLAVVDKYDAVSSKRVYNSEICNALKNTKSCFRGEQRFLDQLRVLVLN
ncbi:HD domain-containing protein [Candidatus Woesearchaeota archaeon]|nr:HD domain-containing protein [Candidatus Woesearchaeota archaeon]